MWCSGSFKLPIWRHQKVDGQCKLSGLQNSRVWESKPVWSDGGREGKVFFFWVVFLKRKIKTVMEGVRGWRRLWNVLRETERELQSARGRGGEERGAGEGDGGREGGRHTGRGWEGPRVVVVVESGWGGGVKETDRGREEILNIHPSPGYAACERR